MSKKIIVKQVKSQIKAKPEQRKTLQSLGLRKISAEREHNDNAAIRGMIAKVNHLVTVIEK